MSRAFPVRAKVWARVYRLVYALRGGTWADAYRHALRVDFDSALAAEIYRQAHPRPKRRGVVLF